MLRNRVVIGGALLGLVLGVLAWNVPAAAQGGWRGLIADLLGEGSTHLVLVRGTVQFDGVTIAGGDFTVTKSTTVDGTYLVIYTGGTFLDTPTVLVQPVGTDVDANEAIAYVESETLVGFNVETKFAGALSDRSFKFIAVGPR